MKILVIDHLAVQNENRHLYHYLSQSKEIKLTILIPARWRENYSDIKVDRIELNKKIVLRVGQNLFSGRPHLTFYLTGLLACIKEKPDIIYVNAEPENLLTLQVALYSKLFSLRSRIIFVTWRNIAYSVFSFPYRASWLHFLIEKLSFHYAHGCRSFNLSGVKCLKLAGFQKKIRMIPWGIDLDFFTRRNNEILKRELNLNSYVIGYIGRFVKPKGIDLLIRAASKIKNVPFSLLLIGNGPEKKNLLQLIENYNMGEKTIFIETVGFKEIPKYLSCMDILVLPSRTTPGWKEQFGRVLVEAMASEVVVIGSNSGEIPNVIGNSGLTFKENNSDDLLEKIKMVLESDDLRKRLIEKGRERALNLFSWNRIAKDMAQFFNEIK